MSKLITKSIPFIVTASLLTACGSDGSADSGTDAGVSETYLVSTQFTLGGSIHPTQITAEAGERVELQLSVDEYFHLETIAGCGGQLDNDLYVINSLESNCVVSAQFAEDYIQFSGTAPHIDGNNFSISFDGFSEEETSSVAHDEFSFSVKLKVSGDKLADEDRIRLRITGSSKSGEPIQYTTTVPSLGQLYIGERTYLDTQDYDALHVTAMTTSVDAYISSLLGKERFTSAEFDLTLEVFDVQAVIDRLIIAEAIYQKKIFEIFPLYTSLYQLLSSRTMINEFIQGTDLNIHQELVDSALISLRNQDRQLTEKELFAFNRLHSDSESKSYLFLREGTLTHATRNDWFNNSVPVENKDGSIILIHEQRERTVEDAELYCILPDSDIKSIANPQGFSVQVACEVRLHSLWNAMTLENGNLVALKNERYIYEQEVFVGTSLVKIEEQTDLQKAGLSYFSYLPSNWSVGTQQIDMQYGDLWVLPSLTNDTNLFELSADQTYHSKVLFESQLEAFSFSIHDHIPNAFNERGVWFLEQGRTRVRLAIGNNRFAEIEKVEDDATELLYLVTFKKVSPEVNEQLLTSRRVLRLGRVINPLHPSEFQVQTANGKVLSQVPAGDTQFRFPALRTMFYGRWFGEDEGIGTEAVCDSMYLPLDNCDGDYKIQEQYRFDLELFDTYMLTHRRLGNSSLLRAFALLESKNDEMVIFEQAVVRYDNDIFWYPQYQPLIGGRMLKWISF